MNWKNWPYWVKGGCVLIVIHTAISMCLLIWYLFESNSVAPVTQRNWSFLVLLFMDFPASYVWRIAPLGDNDVMQIGEVIALGTMQWFAIGSFLGWFHGKIKNRKSSAAS